MRVESSGQGTSWRESVGYTRALLGECSPKRRTGFGEPPRKLQLFVNFVSLPVCWLDIACKRWGGRCEDVKRMLNLNLCTLGQCQP